MSIFSHALLAPHTYHRELKYISSNCIFWEFALVYRCPKRAAKPRLDVGVGKSPLISIPYCTRLAISWFSRKVYDSEEDMLESLARKEIKAGMVVVIRYEGPKGGPGMPEMLTPSSAIMGAGLGSSVALITDGRFSGGSHG